MAYRWVYDHIGHPDNFLPLRLREPEESTVDGRKAQVKRAPLFTNLLHRKQSAPRIFLSLLAATGQLRCIQDSEPSRTL